MSSSIGQSCWEAAVPAKGLPLAKGVLLPPGDSGSALPDHNMSWGKSSESIVCSFFSAFVGRGGCCWGYRLALGLCFFLVC